ncbi:hypothetical protein F2Q68_00021034 [Brassica cretica]|uniref:Uncharacterized protein n=1 Tax=Brassica cretica TaxID=69181 RepID=A0A8S9FTS2_BRACR|nr:hypothetical protein F2Q68_00021034 [Brassica cretica]
MSKKINERDREDLLITSSCHLSLTLKKFQRLNLWHEVSDTPLSEISVSSLSWMSRDGSVQLNSSRPLSSFDDQVEMLFKLAGHSVLHDMFIFLSFDDQVGWPVGLSSPTLAPAKLHDRGNLWEGPPGFPPLFSELSKQDNIMALQYISHVDDAERMARI